LASAQPNKFWHTILVERSRGRDHRHVCGHAFLDRTNQRICTERRSRSNERFFSVRSAFVEEEHRGMVNKYLGDGFMAIFGVGESGSNHAGDALAAGRENFVRCKRAE